ncbi:hypothetical protein BEE62_17275 [Marinobacter nauticus]|uniref:Uncharacterized protein n=1 Tax=Marinobacter nauticus TaxID=2743 RepID=A0A1M2URX0_MARNT|nr:hypothetical protein BEE62_17275 [Marinobacter nauticus]
MEYPFRYINQVFGYGKVRYRGLAKNTSRLHLLAAFSNLLIGEKDIIEAQQKSLDLEPGWKPMATVHDRAVVMFERLMERLMAEERE